MPITIDAAALNLILAVFCGALIGSERQVRQRMAGLRTNALVALGAASFVVFSALYPDDLSPTRVAAQVVSGIGFLGAGIIFRHGFTIHGLNTAATLWCSASVGLLAGSGAADFALMATAMIVFVNLGLRPVVKWIKRKTGAGMPLAQDYRLLVTCAAKHEAKVRAQILRTLSLPEMSVSGFDKSQLPDSDLVTLDALVSVDDVDEGSLNKVFAAMIVDPRVQNLSWESSGDG